MGISILGISVQGGVSVQGSLSIGSLSEVSLSVWGLCLVVSVQESLFREVSVWVSLSMGL